MLNDLFKFVFKVVISEIILVFDKIFLGEIFLVFMILFFSGSIVWIFLFLFILVELLVELFLIMYNL